MSYGNFNPIVENSFMSGKAAKYCNSQTDGSILLLFGNKIAEHRSDGLWITNCGYQTNTTKNHLNKLEGVSIYQKNWEWYLNGEKWDGSWIKVSDMTVEVVATKNDKEIFDMTTHCTKEDAWRPTFEPVYAVCGANNTGSWDDSPCPESVCHSELSAVESLLKAKRIPYVRKQLESSNVFMVREFVVVPPKHIEVAKDLVLDHLNSTETSLIYSC
jgi:hypothetical protein